MTPTPIALLQQAADYKLKLGFEPPLIAKWSV
jgi:hypothetical protein